MGKISRFLPIILLVIIAGCKGSQSAPSIHPPPVPEEVRLPVDYVFLLDNSGSIPRGESRTFAKEAIKAFIELAEIGDRISLITFDTDARIIATETIAGENERNRLKMALESGFSFRGRHTDISKAITLLRQETASLFRGTGKAKPAVILISDGKLEPRGDVRSSYQRLIQDWQALADIIPFYTIGLGDTEINRDFLPGINGLGLLNRMADSSGGRFFPVRSVEELIETCVDVLRITKGYEELKGQKVFWTDDSTNRLVFLVLKRIPGHTLCTTRDIRVKDFSGKEIDFNHALSNPNIQWRSGEFYDLIIIQEPSAGGWEVILANGDFPRVATLIRNQVHLRYLVNREYWDREKKTVMAWLYDERTGAISERPCKMTLRFDRKKDFQSSDNALCLKRTRKGTYLTQLNIKGETPTKGDYLLQIKARDDKGFFLRKSPVLPVRIKEAFFTFKLPEGTQVMWPILWKGVSFVVEFDTHHRNYPRFSELPRIFLYLDKVKKQGNTHLPIMELKHKKVDGKILYYVQRADLERGRYVAQVVIAGRLANGKRVRIESPFCLFDLKWAVWVWGIFALLGVVLLLSLAYVLRPRLSGKLIVEKPMGRPDILMSCHKKVKKSLSGDSLRCGNRRDAFTELEETAFTLSATWGRGLRIRAEKGNIFIERQGDTKPVVMENLYGGDFLIFKDNGRDYVVRIVSRKRPPRSKGRRLH